MKHMRSKPDNSAMIAAFLQGGGKITRFSSSTRKAPPKAEFKVNEAEIDVAYLPKSLAAKFFNR